jgi:phosphonate transport system substrate-binding protein
MNNRAVKRAAAVSALVALVAAGLIASTSSASRLSPSARIAASCPHNPIRWAIEPYDTSANIEKAYTGLAAALGQKLGCQVQLIVSNSYVAEIEAMRGGNLEMGEFGPLGYVLAHHIADAIPVAAFGDKNHHPDIYYAGIWVPKSSPITSLKGLAGHTLGLSGPTSTSGGLYPMSALIKAGFHCTASTLSCSGVSIKVTGGHPQSLLALTHGSLDAAEVNSQEEASAMAAHQFNPANYREIWKSTPIINDPVTVYGHLGGAFLTRIKMALLSLSAKQLATVDTELGTKSNGPMVPATNGLYNNVRAVANAVHLTASQL